MRTHIAILLGTLVTMPTIAAEPYPSRPVRLIVPTSAGGGVDFVARLLASRLAEAWGQQVVVDNRSGATGLIGLELTARASPDGHTFVLANLGHMMTATLSGRLSFEEGRDFTPVILAAHTATLYVVHPAVPVKSVADLVKLARAKPGEIRYASGGVAGLQHMFTELFKSVAGVDMVHVPYKGTGPGLTDLLAGQVQLTVTSASSLLPHVAAGKLRALAVTGSKRLKSAAEIPTLTEAGYGKADAMIWYGLLGPTKLPGMIATRVNASVNQVLSIGEIRERMANAGTDPAGGTQREFVTYLRAEFVKWNDIIKVAGIKLQ